MIDPKELRIGNSIFNTTTGREEKVWGIKPDRRNHLMVNDTEIEYINPINLTREALEKRGFYYDHDGYVLDSKLGVSLSIDLVSGLCYYFGNIEPFWVDVLREIKYLHQLQNLWFDLTGEEI